MTTNGNVITGGSNEVLHSLHPRLKYPELWRGCVGAWCPSMGKTGEKLFDYSGYGNHGTLTNMDPATDWVTSDGKGALDFDGVDDVVTSTASNITSVTQNLTASAWFQLNATGVEQTLFGPVVSDNNTRRFSAHCPWSDGVVYFDFGGDSGVNRLSVAGLGFTTGIYYHMCFFAGSTGMRIHKDGKLVASSSTAVTRAASSAGFEIGRFENTNFPGKIDDFRIYNRALTHQEIKILASSRGAAYQKRKVTSVLFSSGTPASNRRNNMLIGCGF